MNAISTFKHDSIESDGAPCATSPLFLPGTCTCGRMRVWWEYDQKGNQTLMYQVIGEAPEGAYRTPAANRN